MSRKINLISVCAISALFLFFLYASHKLSSPTYTTEYYKPREYRQNYHNLKTGNNRHIYNNMRTDYVIAGGGGVINGAVITVPTQNTTVTIEDILNEQRERIADEMLYFEYPGGRFGIDAEKLSDLTLETKGNPVRSIIITTWRSGSTFLGDILNAMPANFYHYEPLLNYDIIQIRGPPYEKPAINNLKKLLNCDYTNMDEYLEYGKTHTYLFSHNTRLWKQCKAYTQFCWEPKFLESFCKLFPLQSMKIVRLRLSIAAQLLEDESLNVRIVLLIRDPRGSLQSRKHRDWCKHRPDCDHPPTVCRDMVANFYSAVELTKKYPQRFRAVRYEDLSLNPYEITQDILQFYGHTIDPQVEEFLDSHTKSDIGGVSSTFRDSKSAPFHWIKDLTYEEVDAIQIGCSKAMHLWGYKKVTNDTMYNNNFDPLLSFPFS